MNRVLVWARAHRKLVLAVAAGVVGVVAVVRPDFPGHAVLSALTVVLGG